MKVLDANLYPGCFRISIRLKLLLAKQLQQETLLQLTRWICNTDIILSRLLRTVDFGDRWLCIWKILNINLGSIIHCCCYSRKYRPNRTTRNTTHICLDRFAFICTHNSFCTFICASTFLNGLFTFTSHQNKLIRSVR